MGPGARAEALNRQTSSLGNCWSMCANSRSTLTGSAASQGCVVALVSAASRVSLAGSREAMRDPVAVLRQQLGERRRRARACTHDESGLPVLAAVGHEGGLPP